MSIELTCSECGKRLKASEKLLGRKVKCPQCGQVVQVAAPDAAPPPPPSEAPSLIEPSNDDSMGLAEAPDTPAGASPNAVPGSAVFDGASPIGGQSEGSGLGKKIGVLVALLVIAGAVAVAVMMFTDDDHNGRDDRPGPVRPGRPSVANRPTEPARPDAPSTAPETDTPDRTLPSESPTPERFVGPPPGPPPSPDAPRYGMPPDEATEPTIDSTQLPAEYAHLPGEYQVFLEAAWADAFGRPGAQRLGLPQARFGAAFSEGQWTVDIADLRWTGPTRQLDQMRIELPLSALAASGLERLPFADQLEGDGQVVVRYDRNAGFVAEVTGLAPVHEPPQVQTYTRRPNEPQTEQIIIPADAKVEHEREIDRSGRLSAIKTTVTVRGQAGLIATTLKLARRATPQPQVVTDLLVEDEMAQLHGRTGVVQSLDITGDGQRVVTLDRHGNVLVWHVGRADAPPQVSIPMLRTAPGYVQFLPGGERLLVAGGRGGTLALDVVNIADGRVVRRLDVSTIRDRQPADANPDWPVSPSQFTGLWLSRNGRAALATGQSDQAWSALWAINSGELLAHRPLEEQVAISPDGRAALLGDAICRAAPNAPVIAAKDDLFEDHRSRTTAAPLPGLANGGQLMATAGNNHNIRLINVSLRTDVGELVGHQGAVRQMLFIDQARRLVTTGMDGRIIIWDVERREPLGELAWAAESDGRGRTDVRPERRGYDSFARMDRFVPPDRDNRRAEVTLLPLDVPPFVSPAGMTASSADGARIVCADAHGVVHVYNLPDLDARQRALPTIAMLEPVVEDEAKVLAASPDGRFLVVDVSSVQAIQEARRAAAEEARQREQRRREIAQRSSSRYDDRRTSSRSGDRPRSNLTDTRRREERLEHELNTHLRRRGTTESLVEYDDPISQNKTVAFEHAAYGPLNAYVAMSNEGRLYVFRAGSGRPVGRNTEDLVEARVEALHYSPDGRYVLVVAQQDGGLYQFDARSLRLVHEYPPSAVEPAMSPDGKLLAIATPQGSNTVRRRGRRGFQSSDDIANIRIYDLQTGEPVASTQPMTDLVFSPDSRYLAGVEQADDRRGEVVLADVTTGLAARRFGFEGGGVAMPAFSPDGTVLATWADPPDGGDRGYGGSYDRRSGGGQQLLLWDVTTGARLVAAPFEQARPVDIRFAEDGHRVVVTMEQDERYVVAWQDQAALRAHPIDSPDELDAEALVKIADVDRPARSRTLAVGLPASGSRVAVADRMGSSTWIRISDVRSGEVIRPLNAGGSLISAMAYSPISADLAVCGDDSMVHLWRADASTAAWTSRVDAEALGLPRALAWSDDGRWIAVGGSGAGNRLAGVLSAQDGDRLATLTTEAPGAVDQLRFTPDGDQLLIAAGKRLTVWNTDTWRMTAEHRYPRPIWHLSADGRYVLVSSDPFNPASIVEPAADKVHAVIEARTATDGLIDARRKLVMLIDEPTGWVAVHRMRDGRRIDQLQLNPDAQPTAFIAAGPGDRRMATVPRRPENAAGRLEPIRVWKLSSETLAMGESQVVSPGKFFVTWLDYSPIGDTVQPGMMTGVAGAGPDDPETEAMGKLKIARLTLSAGKEDAARQMLVDVVRQYGDTDAGAKARQMLEKMGVAVPQAVERAAAEAGDADDGPGDAGDAGDLPDDPEAAGQLRLAKLLMAAGRKDEARKSFDRIARDYPNTKSGREAAKLRDQLLEQEQAAE